MSDGRQPGEAVVVIVTVVALLLSAAFLPLVDVFDGGSLNFGVDSDLGSDEGIAGGGAGDRGEIAGSVSGSPIGGSLTSPEESSISGGRESGEPLQSVPLFVVESPVNTYWRQTAYTSYTGTGWTQSADDQPIVEGVPNGDRTADSRSIEYDVTLLTDSRSLPTAWQPETVELVDESDTTIRASTVGGINTDRSLSKDTTYTAESSLPPSDPEVLRSANGYGPADLRETYTQLPDETPSRVARRTEVIIGDERTRYDTVMAVHDWLESNRGYSLETEIDPDQPIADQLLFEVDTAYCQHFATTMTAMLRSQDIPARYVVGFAEGKPVGDNEYLVTSDRAHAWVEVYFEGVGWVRFDPTPGGELPVDSPQPPYDISLNRSAVVGAPVAISVDKNDSAVTGVPVYVNDERVGWTDASGELDTTLPYAEEVTITARPAGSETKYSDSSGSTTTVAAVGAERVTSTVTAARTEKSTTATPRADAALSAVAPHIEASLSAAASSLSFPLYRVATPAIDLLSTIARQTGDSDDTDDGESSVSYSSETNATVSVGGSRTTGGTARLVVTVEDVPVANATVEFDGDPVGETDAAGSYELSLANVEPGSYFVTVTRRPVEASTTVTVSAPDDVSTGSGTTEERDPLAPNVSVSPTLIALPGGSATAMVSRDGRPISGTPVRVGDTVVGETDANGTVGFGFPISNTVVVAARADGVTGQQSVDGLFRNAGGVVIAVVGMVVGLGGIARRYGISRQLLTTKLATFAGILTTVPHRLTALVIRLATGFEAAIEGVWRRLRSLPTLLSGSLTDVLSRLNPYWLLLAVIGWIRTQLRGVRRTAEDTTVSEESTAAATTEHRRVRAIWATFVEFVRPPGLRTRTAAEIGRYATDRGLPRRPVELLTELYRAVEYGRRSPDDSRLEAARNALAAIQEGEDDE